MPSLPLPPGGCSIGGGDLPVTAAGDVCALLPAEIRSIAVAPVRDGLCAAFAAGFIEYQTRAERAAAMVDPLRSTGDHLRTQALDRGVVPTSTESEETLRSRLFSAPTIVTPSAIVSRVSAIIAPYTSRKMTMFEPELDGMFICDGTVDFGYIGSDPVHPDRLYPDDIGQNGTFIPNSSPSGAALSNGYPRTFVIRVPALEGADDNFAFISTADEGLFCTDGTEVIDYGGNFVYADTSTTEDLYASIVSTVESIKGQGMSWTMFVDPTL